MLDPFLGSESGASGTALLVLALLVKATLILGAAWALERLSRRASAAVRHGIWALSLLVVVALPVAPLWLPELRVDLSYLPVEAARPPAPLTAAAPAAPSLSAPAVGGAAPAPTGVAGLSPRHVAAAPEPAPAFDWPRAVLLLWAAGASLRMAWLALQFARVRRLSVGVRAERFGPLALRAETLAGELGIRRPVRVMESARVSMPLTWGMLRPTILLPREAREWPVGRLRVVLLHELAHIRRWDYLTYLLAEVACAVYWPVPLVWLARRRVRVEQEQACDDLVLASGTGSLEYAEHLLSVARAFYGNRWELGATVSMAGEISLKDRIRTILDERTNRRPLLSGSGVLLLLLLSGFTLPVAAIRPSAAGAETDAPDSREEPSRPTPATPAASPVEVAAPDPADAAPFFLWLESEDGAADRPMEVREDLDASSGAYLVVPDGRGNDAPDGGPGQVRFEVEVPATGEYYLWGRVIGASGNDNSLYVSIEGVPEVAWHLAAPGGGLVREWGWVPLALGEEARGPAPLRLSAGTRTVRIRNREDGTRLDRLLITSDPAFVPSGRGPGALARPTYRWMDGEKALLTGAVERRVDEKTSSGEYVSFEGGRGGVPGGTATFAFDVERAGRYVVWGRVLALDDGANSFHVSVDGGAEVIWDAPAIDPGPRSGWWSWSALSAREYQGRAVDPLLLDLAPGRHELRLRVREAGTRLDGLLITDDLGFRPRGIWPGDLPARPVRVTLPAESARLSSPLMVRADSAAGGGLYLAAEAKGSVADRPAGGAPAPALLRFSLREAGLYSLWARTLVRNDGEDSFWVRVNGGGWIRWNAIPTGPSWRWSMVHDADRQREVTQFQLEPGENTIEIAPREAGARLDELVVTNDPLFEPPALAAP